MTEEHEKCLFERAPILYGGKKKPLTESLMSFGFMCGDGWFWPLLTLSENLEGLNVALSSLGVWVEAVEVKEKFGTLRFYIDVLVKLPWYKRLWNVISPMHPVYESQAQRVMVRYASNVAEEWITKCEAECHNYCEFCGTPFGSWNKDDRVITKGWISYICKKCAEEKKLRYSQYYEENKLHYSLHCKEKNGNTEEAERDSEGEGGEADSKTP